MRKIVSERQLKRFGINKDLIDKWDKELKAIGGVRILFFKVSDVLELFSAAVLIFGVLAAVMVIGVLNGASVLALSSVLVGAVITFYYYWRQPIDRYKESFLKEDELTAAAEIFVNGLEVGMSIENIIGYIVRNRKGVVRDLLYEAQIRLDAGSSLKDALNSAAEKSLNEYFRRFVRIITGEYGAVADIKNNLEEFLEEVEEAHYNRKLERAAKLDNSLFFPIFLGYFVPILVLFSLPFVLSLRSFFKLY